MARQLKELRSLMPWTWDTRVESHPPGEAAMRDFEDCHNWNRGPRRPAQTPTGQAASSRKRAAKVIKLYCTPLSKKCAARQSLSPAWHAACAFDHPCLITDVAAKAGRLGRLGSA